MTGPAGSACIGGREAAKLANWELSAERGRVVIRATLQDVNSYRLESSEVFDVILGSRVYKQMPIHIMGNQVTFVKIGEEKHGQE